MCWNNLWYDLIQCSQCPVHLKSENKDFVNVTHSVGKKSQTFIPLIHRLYEICKLLSCSAWCTYRTVRRIGRHRYCILLTDHSSTHRQHVWWSGDRHSPSHWRHRGPISLSSQSGILSNIFMFFLNILLIIAIQYCWSRRDQHIWKSNFMKHPWKVS